MPSLVKLAKASDPRTSSLAVFGKGGKLRIWALIDQGTHYFDYMNLDTKSAQAKRPGLFQASIEGVAHLIAWIDYFKVAELRGTNLLGPAIDAIPTGPVLAALEPGINSLFADVQEALPVRARDIPIEQIVRSVYREYTEALRRVLLCSRNYRHGGGLLVLPPNATTDHLNIKYELKYGRLREAIEQRVIQNIVLRSSRNTIRAARDVDRDVIPRKTHLHYAIAKTELDDVAKEINGAVWFIALLTRVDGLVLFDSDLRVLGSG